MARRTCGVLKAKFVQPLTNHSLNPPHALYTNARRWWLLAVLFLVSTSNYVDRSIISVLLEPIKKEFGASDTALGLLSGFAIAVFYATLGIPVARWADCGNRRVIVTLALSVWSLMTMFCGVAQTFWQLALARVGVGAGEAGAIAPGQSLIADYFTPEHRARAYAIFTAAATAGYLIAFVGGAQLVTAYGWRTTFFVVGAPGLALAIVTYVFLKEPRETIGYPPAARTPVTRRRYVRWFASEATCCSSSGWRCTDSSPTGCWSSSLRT